MTPAVKAPLHTQGKRQDCADLFLRLSLHYCAGIGSLPVQILEVACGARVGQAVLPAYRQSCRYTGRRPATADSLMLTAPRHSASAWKSCRRAASRSGPAEGCRAEPLAIEKRPALRPHKNGAWA